MRAYTLTAARSGLLAISAAVIMSAAWCALIQDAPLSYMVHAFCAMPTKPLWWVMVVAGGLGLFAWTCVTAGRKAGRQHSPWRRIAVWVGSTLATAVAMAILAQGVQELGSVLDGMRFPSNWHSFLHILQAAIIAAVVVRLALPLIPHFDRMAPRSM